MSDLRHDFWDLLQQSLPRARRVGVDGEQMGIARPAHGDRGDRIELDGTASDLDAGVTVACLDLRVGPRRAGAESQLQTMHRDDHGVTRLLGFTDDGLALRNPVYAVEQLTHDFGDFLVVHVSSRGFSSEPQATRAAVRFESIKVRTRNHKVSQTKRPGRTQKRPSTLKFARSTSSQDGCWRSVTFDGKNADITHNAAKVCPVNATFLLEYSSPSSS